MGLWLWAVVPSGIYVGGPSFPLTPVLSDYFLKKIPGLFWEIVSLERKVFREFVGFWVGLFKLKFR